MDFHTVWPNFRFSHVVHIMRLLHYRVQLFLLLSLFNLCRKTKNVSFFCYCAKWNVEKETLIYHGFTVLQKLIAVYTCNRTRLQWNESLYKVSHLNYERRISLQQTKKLCAFTVTDNLNHFKSYSVIVESARSNDGSFWWEIRVV